MKNSREVFKGRFEQAKKKESVNLKTGQWKLSSLRKERKKFKEK